MRTNLKSFLITSGMIAAFALLGVTSANAQAFGTSSVASLISGLVTDLGLIIAGIITVILGLWAALVGAGWGIGKFKKYIAGRKV